MRKEIEIVDFLLTKLFASTLFCDSFPLKIKQVNQTAYSSTYRMHVSHRGSKEIGVFFSQLTVGQDAGFTDLHYAG